MRILGIDTSNYATSAALYNAQTGEVEATEKILLEVAPGGRGLRQSDAVFQHVRNLPRIWERLAARTDYTALRAVGVSDRPRDVEKSYMPCFLAGVSAASAVTGTQNLPLYRFSHQAGHVAAALLGTGFAAKPELNFIAFHVSGGTTDALVCRLDGPQLTITQAATSFDLFAGQAVDRLGVRLGFSFPAGEALTALARDSDTEEAAAPVLREGNCCLSGLENQCIQRLENGASPAQVARFCLNSIADTILAMAQTLQSQGDKQELILAGGVMCSDIIRARMAHSMPQARFCQPAWLSADNGAGVALLAARRELYR